MDQEIPRFESQISARPVEEIREQRFRFLCRLDKNKSDGNRGGQRVVKTNSESWAFFCSVLNDRARRRILRISRETTNKKKKERERERERKVRREFCKFTEWKLVDWREKEERKCTQWKIHEFHAFQFLGPRNFINGARILSMKTCHDELLLYSRGSRIGNFFFCTYAKSLIELIVALEEILIN